MRILNAHFFCAYAVYCAALGKYPFVMRGARKGPTGKLDPTE